MSIILDRQLREKMAHDGSAFPISYFQDELALLPNQVGPLHWHPEFEIATAASGVLEYQVGQERITLDPGDSNLVGGNMLHSIRQLSGDVPDPMPNIVFFGSLIAPENSTIHAQYIQPIIDDHALPYVVFRHGQSEHAPVNGLIRDIYRLFVNSRTATKWRCSVISAESSSIWPCTLTICPGRRPPVFS